MYLQTFLCVPQYQVEHPITDLVLIKDHTFHACTIVYFSIHALSVLVLALVPARLALLLTLPSLPK